MKKMWKRICTALLCGLMVTALTAPAFAAYRDVPASYWAAEDIRYVTERGLFKGVSTDAFGPSEKMSRAMLATVLYRYAGSPAVSRAAPYVDVTAGTWYTPGVTWAYQEKIFASVNLTRTILYPDEDVRRAEFCVMLYNFAKSLGKAASDPAAMARSPFTDMEWKRFSFAGFGPIYNEAEEAMLGWAWPMGIMEGTSATTINPLGSITRAEVAAMLARFDRNVLGGTKPVALPTPTPQPDPEPDSSILPDGKVLTEEAVRAAILTLKENHPHNTVYQTPYIPNSGLERPFSNCNHCAGWAMLCSDAAFGDMPWRTVDRPVWSDIRAGDVIVYKNPSTRHAIVVLEKTDDQVVVTESNTANKTLWGGQYPRWWLEQQPSYILKTRYPQ